MDAEESEKVMGAPSKFDVCEYGRAESLFHCSEPHEVLGVSHDHRCDEIRAKFRALADEVGRLRAERIEVLALLGDTMSFDALDYCSIVDDAKPSELDCDEPDGRQCWEHRRRALAAKLRGAP